MGISETAYLRLPELGEGIEKATIACWHVQPGQRVQQDDDLVELVTDKAAFNVTAERDAVVTAILVPEGQEAKVGQPLAALG